MTLTTTARLCIRISRVQVTAIKVATLRHQLVQNATSPMMVHRSTRFPTFCAPKLEGAKYCKNSFPLFLRLFRLQPFLVPLSALRFLLLWLFYELFAPHDVFG